MPNQTVGDLLGAIERIGPLIAEHAATAEADRQPSGAVYQPPGLRLGAAMKRLCGAVPAGAINTSAVAPCTGASRLMPPRGA